MGDFVEHHEFAQCPVRSGTLRDRDGSGAASSSRSARPIPHAGRGPPTGSAQIGQLRPAATAHRRHNAAAPPNRNGRPRAAASAESRRSRSTVNYVVRHGRTMCGRIALAAYTFERCASRSVILTASLRSRLRSARQLGAGSGRIYARPSPAVVHPTNSPPTRAPPFTGPRLRLLSMVAFLAVSNCCCRCVEAVPGAALRLWSPLAEPHAPADADLHGRRMAEKFSLAP